MKGLGSVWWLFAVQAALGSLVAVTAGLLVNAAAAWSALAAAGLVVSPNTLLLFGLGRLPQSWAIAVLLLGKLCALFCSLLGLVWLSRVWPGFEWSWALVSLGVVVVSWLWAPTVLGWAERSRAHQRIDEIIASSGRSSGR